MAQSQELRSVELPREARKALANCNDAVLEELRVLAGELAWGISSTTHLRGIDRAEFDAFAALVEITRENIMIVRRSKVHGPARLEYQPFLTRTEDGAMS